MSEEQVRETVQENQETLVENKPESPSNDGLLSEVMAKKEKIKTLEAELAKRDADNEKRRVKKLENEGKHKELIAEQSSTIDNLKAKLESQTGIVNNYKQNLINGLASDDERKEYLSTKSVDFLEELTKEKNLMQPQTVSNPGESLGAVRKTVSTKSFADMNEAERREWHKQMTTN
jgi:hypothetical protein